MSRENLWQTTIELHDLADQCDLEMALTECLLVSNALHDKENRPLEQWDAPELLRIHRELIEPLFLKYLDDVYGHRPDGLKVSNWVFGGNGGGGLECHVHSGSHFSAVFYPTDSSGQIVLCDPRFNASRGYPREIIDNHFSKRKITPKAGQLLIMPSFVEHFVTPHPDKLRLSFVSDIQLKRKGEGVATD